MKFQPTHFFGHGIYAIDSQYWRPFMDAVHLVIENDRIAVIDPATTLAVPIVLQAIQDLGYSAESVDWVIATHVHLDHAGGAGALMSACPNARLGVHPRGAQHLIHPERLWASTCEVYGAENARALYGEIVPTPADRVVEMPDGFEIDLAGRVLRILDAPGHAKHHVIIHDTRTNGCFTGDTLGIAYPELSTECKTFVIPSSTPVQFDPVAMKNTLNRVMQIPPSAFYLTHYAQRLDVHAMVADLHRLIDGYVDIALSVKDQGESRQALIESALESLYLNEARQQGLSIPPDELKTLLDVDLRLNATGLICWLDR